MQISQRKLEFDKKYILFHHGKANNLKKTCIKSLLKTKKTKKYALHFERPYIYKKNQMKSLFEWRVF